MPRLASPSLIGVLTFGLASGCFSEAPHDHGATTEKDAPADEVALVDGATKRVGSTGSIFAEGDPGEARVGFGTGDLTVLLVFDKSGSMSSAWEDRPRYVAASDAFLAGMVGVEEQVTIGSIVFPTPTDCFVAPLDDASQIQFQKGTNFLERWNAEVAHELPDGGTPLGLALEKADEVLDEAEAHGLLEDRFRVVIVTDGEPSCGENPSDLIALTADWRARGVEVKVIGLPGSEQAAHFLDALAGDVEWNSYEGDETYAGSAGTYVPVETTDDAGNSFGAAVR